VAAGIKVVLCTVPPENGTWAAFNPAIVDLNTQIVSYGATSGTTVADYYSVIVDPATGLMKAAYAADDTHLNAAGYQAITPLAANAIANAK
jgi:lysophospholipase L1-like esterase